MKEIIPPIGKNKKPKISDKWFWSATFGCFFYAIVCVILVSLYFANEINYITYCIVALPVVAFAFPLVWFTYQTHHAKTVATIKKFGDAYDITLKAFAGVSGFPYLAEWNSKMIIKRSIKKGYLPNYKYLVDKKLLVKIASQENPFQA